jgi:hypothetical protein
MIRKSSSNIDAHFVSDRMQKRKDLYRGIIKGDYEIVDHSSTSVVGDGGISPEDLVNDVDYSLSVLSQQESSTSPSIVEEGEEGYVAMSEHARLARQRRLGSTTTVVVVATSASTTPMTDSEAAKARNLRAQRLRQTQREALQEDEDVLEKLRQRRLEQLEEERKLLKEQAEQEARNQMEEDRLNRERAALAEERRLLEQAKRLQAREQDIKERQLLLRKKQGKNLRQQPDPPGEYSLMEEVQMLMRESGVFKTCVSSCFGEDEDDVLSTSTANIANTDAGLEPPSLRNTKSNRTASFSSKNTGLLSFGSGLSDLKLDESGNPVVPKY